MHAHGMHPHGPDELTGPIRGTPGWWHGTGPPPEPEAPPAPVKTRKKRKDARPVRMELVNRVRAEIAAGTYDTQEKWEAALERLLERME